MKAIACMLMLLLAATTAVAQEAVAGDIHVDQAWSRAMPPVSPTGAVYLRLRNSGSVADRLRSVSAAVANTVEIHKSTHEDGMMSMVAVDGVDVPAGGEAIFAPGGLHLMLIGLNDSLVAGESFEVTLRFEHAGDVTLTVPVLDPGSAPMGGKSHGAAKPTAQ